MRKNKYTFFGVLNTWGQLMARSVFQWRIFGVYAAFMTFVSALFGHWSYACRNGEADFWCFSWSHNKYLGIIGLCIFSVLMLYLICAFITDLYNATSENTVFKPRDIFAVSGQKIKTTITLTTIFLSATVSLIVAYYIIQRPANPSFDIEFGYFLIVFVLLLIPLMMIRCAACFAYYMHTGHFSLRKVYDHTSGRSYISVMMFLLLLIVLLVVNMRLYGFFTRIAVDYNSFTAAVATDFADNLFKLICLTTFLQFTEAQYLRMEETAKLREAEVAAREAEAVAKEPEESENTTALTAKAAKKKKNQRKSQTSSAPKTKRKSDK